MAAASSRRKWRPRRHVSLRRDGQIQPAAHQLCLVAEKGLPSTGTSRRAQILKWQINRICEKITIRNAVRRGGGSLWDPRMSYFCFTTHQHRQRRDHSPRNASGTRTDDGGHGAAAPAARGAPVHQLLFESHALDPAARNVVRETILARQRCHCALEEGAAPSRILTPCLRSHQAHFSAGCRGLPFAAEGRPLGVE